MQSSCSRFLADRDASLLRRAALAGEWVDPATWDLLLDATQECQSVSSCRKR